MPRKINYDVSCYDLAASFLLGNQEINTEQKRDELAQHIQREIDEWIEFEKTSHQTQASDRYSPTVKRVAKNFDQKLRERR